MKIETKLFKDIIKELEPAILKSNEIPILTNILLSNEYIQSYNSHIGCHITTDVFSNLTEKICVPFAKVRAFTFGAPTDSIEIEIEQDTMKLKSGRSSATVPIQSGNDFPDFESLIVTILENSVDVSNDIYTGLKLCSLFTSKFGNRGVIHGVNLQSRKAQASDGKRIALYTFDEELPQVNMVISTDLIKALTGSQFIYTDKDKIAIGKENIIYFASIIQGDFPEVSKYFPEVKSYIKLPIEEMRASLKKIGDFSEDGTDAARCKITFDKGIEIKYEGQTAHVQEFFDFGEKVKAKSYKLNPYHFEKLLQVCNVFSFTSVNNFDVLYGGTEDNKFKCIISLEKV